MKLLALALLGCAPTVVWQGRSPDRTHIARVIVDGDQQRVEVDGHRHRSHDGIGIAGVVLSDDRVAYPARDGNEWRVVVSRTEGESTLQAEPSAGPESDTARDAGSDRLNVERPGPVFLGIADVALGPSGEVAYFAQDADGWWVLKDERRNGPYAYLFARTLTFSTTGRIAYVVGSERGARVVGSSQGPWLEGIGRLQFTPDARVLYLGRDGPYARLFVEHVAHPAYERITELHVGRRIAYVAHDSEGSRVVIDGVESEPFAAAGRLLFNDSETHYAYVVERDDALHLAFDGHVLGAHAEVGAFAIGSESLVYSARERDGWYVYATDRHGPFPAVERVAASGTRWSAVVRTATGHVVLLVDGQPAASESFIADLVVAGGSTFYATERDGVSFVVVDGEAYPMLGVIRNSLVATEDGLHWACVAQAEDAARSEDVALRVVLDGVDSVPFHPLELLSAAARGATDLLELSSEAASNMRMIVAAELARHVSR